MLPFVHPFTAKSAIVAGPTSCGKTRFVFRLIDNAPTTIYSPPAKIVYCYGEYQELFRQYPRIQFREGLPDFDGREPTLLIIDDLMQETNHTIANMFTKGSNHRNVSVIFLAQKPVSEKQVCANHESQCPLHGSVQESERRQSVCKSRETDVSEDVPVCRRSV